MRRRWAVRFDTCPTEEGKPDCWWRAATGCNAFGVRTVYRTSKAAHQGAADARAWAPKAIVVVVRITSLDRVRQ